MARRLTRDTYGYVDAGGGIETRHRYLAGDEVPDTVRLEDAGAVDEFDAAPDAGTAYRDYQIAEGANSEPHDHSKVKTEEITDEVGNTIRRTRPSKEAAENRRLRERSVGQVAADEEAEREKSRRGRSEAGKE